MDVGFIGLGKMGGGMAASLLRRGHNLAVYNRVSGKDGDLVRAGAKSVTRIADTSEGDLVFAMLAKDQALENVVFGHGGVSECLRKNSSAYGCPVAQPVSNSARKRWRKPWLVNDRRFGS